MGWRYSAEQMDYLLSLSGLPGKEVAARFNSKFGMNKKPEALRKAAIMHDPNFTLSKDYFTKEENTWLKENRPNYIISELTKEYNVIFGKNRTEASIAEHCKRLGAKAATDGRFRKGLKVWCEGLSAEEMRSHYTEESWKRGRFQPGVAITKKYKVGDEVCNKGNSDKRYIYIKVSDDPTLPTHKQWMAKHRYIWEQAHGPIPEGYMVVFLDGDQFNCVLENLDCVPIRYAGMINSRQWGGNNSELNRLILKYCELTDQINAQRDATLNRQYKCGECKNCYIQYRGERNRLQARCLASRYSKGKLLPWDQIEYCEPSDTRIGYFMERLKSKTCPAWCPRISKNNT